MLTLLRQELFDPSITGYSTYSGSISGNFDYFVGYVSSSYIGPQSNLTSSSSPTWGWSGKNSIVTNSNNNFGYFYFNESSASTSGIVSGWFNPWQDFSNSAGHGTYFFDITRSGGNSWIGTLSTYNENLYVNYGGTQITTGSIIPHQWVWLAVSWYYNGASNNRTIKVFQKILGQPTASLIYTTVNGGNDGSPYTASLGFGSLGGGSHMIGRFGSLSLYSMDSASFVNNILPTDITDPPSGPYTWYVNPAIGNDNNSGLSASQAWQTETKMRNEMSLTQGVFGNSFSGSVGNGDKIILDTSLASLQCSLYGVSLNKSGLWLTSAKSSSFVQGSTGSYAILNPYNIIPNVSWSLVPGKTYTYQATQSSYVTDCVIWENNNWMSQPVGTTYTAVSNSLESTSGSFFQDGVNIYIHPFGNTNPITDGKGYTKSNLLNEPLISTSGSSVINIGNIYQCSNVLVEQMYATKSATYNNSSGLWPSYGLVVSTDVSGNNLIQNCYFNYCGKHTCGITTNSTPNTNITFSGVQAEQSYGANAFVVFSSGTPSANNNVLFTNCTCLASGYVVGSTSGSISAPAMYGHNASGANQFSNVYITNCNFSGGSMNLFTSAVQNTFITNTTCSGVIQSFGTSSIDTSLIGLPIANGGPVTCKNSIVTVNNNYLIVGNVFNNGGNGVSSPMTMTNCTFDLTSINLSGVAQNQCIYDYSAGGSIFFEDNIFICPSNQLTLYGGFPSGSIYSDYNLYVLSGSNTSLSSASLGQSSSSFAAFQTMGLDLHSKLFTTTNSLLLNSNYQPQAGSPTINAGTQLGYYYDITGVTFPSRLTIGAYEYIVSNPILTYTVRQGSANASTSGMQTINNVHLTHPQTVKNSVLKESEILNDPYILSLLEQIEYLRAKRQLTPLLEKNLYDEVSGRMMFLCNRDS